MPKAGGKGNGRLSRPVTGRPNQHPSNEKYRTLEAAFYIFNWNFSQIQAALPPPPLECNACPVAAHLKRRRGIVRC